MLCTSDIYTLINYVGFINYLFYGITVAGQIVLRVKEPNIHRPIKVKTTGLLVSFSLDVFFLTNNEVYLYVPALKSRIQIY